jgi:hypothetical protein
MTPWTSADYVAPTPAGTPTQTAVEKTLSELRLWGDYVEYFTPTGGMCPRRARGNLVQDIHAQPWIGYAQTVERRPHPSTATRLDPSCKPTTPNPSFLKFWRRHSLMPAAPSTI